MTRTAPDTAPRPADAVAGSWIERLPARARPFLRLSRFDRPIGFWLLAWPCWLGLALSSLKTGFGPEALIYAVLFGAGAVAMRGAGCTWNDILDRKIDAQVARTAGRPLASGAVSPKAALVWLILQCLAGLGVLLCLPLLAQLTALAAIPLVAAYPLMKRITWWPQVWLGLTFNWGVLVAGAALEDTLSAPIWLLYAGLALWTLGYDTIYALQDKVDDALIGVKSTARRFGDAVRFGVGASYAVSVMLTACAIALASPALGPLAMTGALPFALHLGGQTLAVRPDMGDAALPVFKSNAVAARWLLLGLLICNWAAYSVPRWDSAG